MIRVRGRSAPVGCPRAHVGTSNTRHLKLASPRVPHGRTQPTHRRPATHLPDERRPRVHLCLGARDDAQPPRPSVPREDVAAHRVVHRQIAQHLILGDDAGACRNASGQTCLRLVDGPFAVLGGRRAPSRPAAAAARPAWSTSSVSGAYTVPARRRRAAGRFAPTPPAPPADARRRPDPRAGNPAARRTRRPRGRGRRRPCPSPAAARRVGRCGPGRPARGARPFGRQGAAGSSAESAKGCS